MGVVGKVLPKALHVGRHLQASNAQLELYIVLMLAVDAMAQGPSFVGRMSVLMADR